MPDVNKPIHATVLELIGAGAPVAMAIQVVLAGSREREDVRTAIPRFAERHGLNAKATASAIYGGRNAPDWVLAALTEELGGTQEQWRELLRYGDRLGLKAVEGLAVCA